MFRDYDTVKAAWEALVSSARAGMETQEAVNAEEADGGDVWRQVRCLSLDPFLEGFLDGDGDLMSARRGTAGRRRGKTPAPPRSAAGSPDLRALYIAALQSRIAPPGVPADWQVESELPGLYQEYVRRMYGAQPAVPLLPERRGGGWEQGVDAGGGTLVPMFRDATGTELETEDQREFAEYQDILGDDAPKSLAEFQDIKYNDPDVWIYLKTKKEQAIFVEQAPCITTPKKYTGYFLKPEAEHADEFFSVGYTTDDPLRLWYDMVLQFDMDKAVDFITNTKGEEKFSIFMVLGVNKKRVFRTVWQKDTPDSIPRIITAHRERRKHDK